ncbi:hypothetical protein [Ferruginibacter sp.]
MANKQYISPIRLLQHCSIDTEGEINLPRIKKQLNAEFGFTKTGFIEVDGYTYNKNDVLEEIDQPDFTERLKYHQRIWESKNILSILEDNTISLYDIKYDFDKFQNDKAFDEFFSPWFAAPFNHISRSFLNEGKLYDLSTLLLFEEFLQPADREEAFKSIRIFLDDNIHLFKNISVANYNSFRPKLKHWYSSGWDEFVNNLPDDFYDYKNAIAFDLINLTVKIQKTNKKDCKAISSGLIHLQGLSNNLRETILNNDSVFNAKVGSGNYSWMIWVGIILVKVLSTGGCN